MIARVKSLVLRHRMFSCVNKCPYVKYTTYTDKKIKIGLRNSKVLLGAITLGGRGLINIENLPYKTHLDNLS